MVAKISFGKSIRGVLIYNEDKVQKGDAELLLASGFATEISNLDLQQKTGRFDKLNRLNPNVKTNTMHISLNFDPSEKLDAQTLQQIAMTYMDQIGFAEQPYVVYSHYDAGHPHLHIATTLMQANGKRKYTHHIGRLVSEPARKHIEQAFGLIKAEGREQQHVLAIRPAVYGEKPTKGQLSSIIKGIVDNYAFSSLAEFNAVLKQFNVRADRGQEDTRMFEKGGLVYTILDELNHPIGVPIKASSFYHKPTFKNLQTKFLEGEQKRKMIKADLKRNLDQLFAKYEQFIRATLRREMSKENIAVVFRQNEKGMIYGITFVDHKRKSVFNGSDLGKAYRARSFSNKLAEKDEPKIYLAQKLVKNNETNQNLKR